MSLAYIAEEHGPALGAIASNIFVACVELLCGAGMSDDILFQFSVPAAGFFLILALLFAWSIVQFEQPLQPGERREQ